MGLPSRRQHELFLSAARSLGQAQWQPAVDAYRTARGWLLKYELAGVRPEDVQITLSGNRIAVHGLRRDMYIEETQQSYYMEISYNQFSRTLELPSELSQMSLATEFRDGMLIVHLTAEQTA